MWKPFGRGRPLPNLFALLYCRCFIEQTNAHVPNRNTHTHTHNVQTALWVLLPPGPIADYMYTAVADEASGAISKIDRRKMDGDLSPEPKPGAEKTTGRLFFTRPLFRSL